MTAQKQQYDVTISLEFERMYKYSDDSDDIFASTDPKVCTGSHGKPQGYLCQSLS